MKNNKGLPDSTCYIVSTCLHISVFQEKANSEGLWNLFISKQDDPEGKYGQGLTHVEYAFIAEETGRSDLAPEV